MAAKCVDADSTDGNKIDRSHRNVIWLTCTQYSRYIPTWHISTCRSSSRPSIHFHEFTVLLTPAATSKRSRWVVLIFRFEKNKPVIRLESFHKSNWLAVPLKLGIAFIVTLSTSLVFYWFCCATWTESKRETGNNTKISCARSRINNNHDARPRRGGWENGCAFFLAMRIQLLHWPL